MLSRKCSSEDATNNEIGMRFLILGLRQACSLLRVAARAFHRGRGSKIWYVHGRQAQRSNKRRELKSGDAHGDRVGDARGRAFAVAGKRHELAGIGIL